MNFNKSLILGAVLASVITACSHAPSSVVDSPAPASQRGVANTLINGIVCIAPPRNRVNPMLIIRDISPKQATLLLNLDGDIPDIRNSFVQKSMQNGRVVAGYLADRSNVDRDAPRFSFYTDGSTKEDTTKGTLSFEDGRPDLAMQCRSGMTE